MATFRTIGVSVCTGPRRGVGKAGVFVKDASYTGSSSMRSRHMPRVRQSAHACLDVTRSCSMARYSPTMVKPRNRLANVLIRVYYTT